MKTFIGLIALGYGAIDHDPVTQRSMVGKTTAGIEKCLYNGPTGAAHANDKFCLDYNRYPGSQICAKQTEEFRKKYNLSGADDGKYICICAGVWGEGNKLATYNAQNLVPELTLEIWGKATHQCANNFIESSLTSTQATTKPFLKGTPPTAADLAQVENCVPT